MGMAKDKPKLIGFEPITTKPLDEQIERLRSLLIRLNHVRFEAGISGRDEKKERRVIAQINALYISIVGAAMSLRDEGIPAAMMEGQSILNEPENRARMADAYWEAKGL